MHTVMYMHKGADSANYPALPVTAFVCFAKGSKHCKHGPGVAATVVDIKNPRGNNLLGC